VDRLRAYTASPLTGRQPAIVISRGLRIGTENELSAMMPPRETDFNHPKTPKRESAEIRTLVSCGNWMRFGTARKGQGNSTPPGGREEIEPSCDF
jgi:hypothetical protein